jgi:hypothetical protein
MFTAIAALEGQQCTNYPAVGTALVTDTLSFPGNPVCHVGAVTNSLSWHASTLGQAACPTQFNTSTLHWAFSLTYFSDSYSGSSGAGCWNGVGPAVFSSGTTSCSSSGDVCQEAYVTTLGQYVGVAPVGVYLAGATYLFGEAYCYPASASATVCRCGPVDRQCPNSTAVCNAAGVWVCANGEVGCYGSAPAPCCGTCYYVCNATGWTCIGSPIALDVYGTGFHFTNVANGVQFRVLPDQDLHQMSWPDAAFRNGWLALDRNGDGAITNLTELFGNATAQPSSDHPNGYLALAVFDNPANGGNGNGVIDPGDAVYDHLRVWIDDNHNGVSEPIELHTL